MDERKIISGQTKAAIEVLEYWFDSEINTELEWDSQCFQKTLKDFLDTRKEVPFRRFLVRYLIVVYGEKFCPELFPDMEQEKWLTDGLEYILNEMTQNEKNSYDSSPKVLQSLTDVVFDTFIENGVYSSKRIGKDGPQKVMGYINGQGLQWTKDLLLKKLKSVKCGADILDMDADITEDEFWAFAFGLNMAYADVDFFIRKVFRRAFANFWNVQDVLLQVTFRYAQGNKYLFYQKLKKFYEKEAEPLENSLEVEKASDYTRAVKGQMDKLLREIEDTEGAISLNEEENLPEKLKEVICKYKYRIQSEGNRIHTTARIGKELLDKFEQSVRVKSGDVEDTNKKKKDDEYKIRKEWTMTGYWNEKASENKISEEKAQGKVLVYYELNRGLDISKGTLFAKRGKKITEEVEALGSELVEFSETEDIEFVSLEDVKIPPVDSRKEDIVIEVRCTEPERKVSKAEEHRAYIPGKTEFMTENKNLSGFFNKSCFKPSGKNVKIGDKIQISGKISGKCEAGKVIPKGTEFYALNAKGETVKFESVKDTGTPVCAEIWVEAVQPGKENTAVKNEITQCSAEGILHIENKKIGFCQKKQDQYAQGNRLFEVLYSKDKVDETLDKLLDDTYIEKIGNIFRGTMLSNTKLYNIQRGTEKNITRKDIVTLSFLVYVNDYESDHSPREKHYSINGYLNFIQKTNDNLEACGFYGLYELNLYDCLLMYLAGNTEAIASYRNIWSWYLSGMQKSS